MHLYLKKLLGLFICINIYYYSLNGSNLKIFSKTEIHLYDNR